MLNRVILMGRLTADPELRQTPNNISVVSFTIAVDRNYASGGQRQTDFINIVAWRNTAEFVSKYFSKGQLVALEGSLQSRSYEDKNGNKRTAFDVVADQVYFAEKKSSAPSSGNTFTPPSFDEPAKGSSFSVGDMGSMGDMGAVGDMGEFEEIELDDGDLPF